MAAATTFAGVVELIRRAEDALIKKAGQSDPKDRARTLRGIFYGTDWSLDYAKESKRNEVGARIRNIGFLTYTGGHLPADPRPALGAMLFADLQASQSIHDRSSGWGIDIGHVLIGLETRESPAMRTKTMPGQGGTGIEIVTWLGDLGGGAANLAKRRATAPGSNNSVESVFHNTTSDYGVMDNLEGDVGGYLVASGTDPGGPPVYPPGKGIADVIATYLPVASSAQWVTRSERFAKALGATVTPRGITNTKTVIDQLTTKLYDFAVWYAATRWVPSGELRGKVALDACMNMKGSATEVATVFVTTLSRAIASPRRPIQATAPYPNPIAPASCDSNLLKAAAIDVSSVSKQLEQWGKDLANLFR